MPRWRSSSRPLLFVSVCLAGWNAPSGRADVFVSEINPSAGSYATNGRVMRYSDAGIPLATFVTGLGNPSGMASDNTYLYVQGVDSALGAVVARYALSDGMPAGEIYVSGIAYGGLAIGPNGHLFVSQGAGTTFGIREYAATAFQSIATPPIRTFDVGNQPAYMTFGSGANANLLYVTSDTFDDVHIYDTAGDTSTYQFTATYVNHPRGLAFSPTDELFVAGNPFANPPINTTYNGVLYRVGADKTPRPAWASFIPALEGLTLGPDVAGQPILTPQGVLRGPPDGRRDFLLAVAGDNGTYGHEVLIIDSSTGASLGEFTTRDPTWIPQDVAYVAVPEPVGLMMIATTALLVLPRRRSRPE